MTRELKIKLDDQEKIVSQLSTLGAQYAGQSTSVHTYFNQPDGLVLKLVEMDGKMTLDRLKREGEQFVFVDVTAVSDKAKMLQELTDQYGLKRKLIMHAKSYGLKNYDVSLYSIDNVGHFLILTGDNPTTDVLYKWFGIDSPEIITVSFDNL